ncbi:KI20B protein, partial [Bucco capensis]|nr:KI20B protein [Bucco capensis]
SQVIQELFQQVEDLKKRLDDTENYNNQLKIKLNEVENQSIKDKDLINQLQEQIQKKTQDSEKQAAEDHRVIAQFEEEVTSYKGKIRKLECLLETFKVDSATKLEEVLEEECIILNVESNTVPLKEKCATSDKKLKELNDQEANLKEEVLQLVNSLESMKHSLQEKEKNEDEQIQTIELLRKDLSESYALVESLKKDLQRKDEEYTDLKEKSSDAKKQIQQVQREVGNHSTNVLVCFLYSFLACIFVFFNVLFTLLSTLMQLNNEKLEEITKQYEKTHKDMCTKEKIIEDMRMTLEEQEQTQIEQDKVLEAKFEETDRLVHELEAWKRKYGELSDQSNSDCRQKMSTNEEKNVNEELIKLQKELEENEAKYQSDRNKWLEEKMRLQNQVKEAENRRNREIRKYAEDRECHVQQQQAEIGRLAAQLVEKDSNLQKWREERDKLVEALEVQLKTLTSSTIQKDKEISELKQAALKDLGKVSFKQLLNSLLYARQQLSCYHRDARARETTALTFLQVLLRKQGWVDSGRLKNGNTSAFPKLDLEIQFTPLEPNKSEVMHQGNTSPFTVTMLKPRRKRKSEEMDEDFVKGENKKNVKRAVTNSSSTSNKKKKSATESFRKEYYLRKQDSTKKKDRTLQKIGDFIQSSPNIFHSKAKKLIATISSPKSIEPENVKGKELKPKRAKRKLYTADNSCLLDISPSSVFPEQKEKESDHLIMKRQLRSKLAK